LHFPSRLTTPSEQKVTLLIQIPRGLPRGFFIRLTGLTPEQFDTLLEALRPVYEQRPDAARAAVRQRGWGGGRRFQLPLAERLLATLLYLRLNLTGALVSYLMNLDESNLCRERNHRMLPALQQVLPTPMQDHLLSALEDPSPKSSPNSSPNSKRRRRVGTLEELLRLHPEFKELCVDATEQKVPRPGHKKGSKDFYSGKSHAHTLKTQITSCGRLIVHLFGGCPGSLADSTMLRASGVLLSISHSWRVPLSLREVRLDRGYGGIQRDYESLPGVHLLAGIKGGGRSKVTLLGRIWNRVMVAKKRIQIEQNIGHLKNWRLLAGLYRGHKSHYHSSFGVIAGLHNFRILNSLSW